MSGSRWARMLEGRVLAGRYAIDYLVGEGGMGAVFSGRQIAIERRVAVKVLSPHVADDAGIAERFHREAVLAAKVARRGVPQIIDYDRDPEAGPFLVMELLEGESLAERVERRERLHPREACAIAVSVLETLEAVHANGIVHRDLKPANVFLAREPDGSRAVKVLDFGVARLLAPAGDMTAHGAVIGTPRYMAPEQALGDPGVDARADVYAVGAILYACLGGRPPYADLSGEAVLAAVRARPTEALASACPDLPPGLCALVDRAMAWLPANRFQDAAAMRRALAAVTAELPEAPPASVGPASRPPASAQATVQDRLGAATTPEGGARMRVKGRGDPNAPTLDEPDDVAAVPSTRATTEKVPRRSRVPWAVAAAVLAVAGGVAVVRAVGKGEAVPVGTAPSAAAGSATVASPPEVSASASASAAPVPVVAASAPSGAASADPAFAPLAAGFERARAMRRAGDVEGARGVLTKLLADIKASNARAPSPAAHLAAAVLITLADIDEQTAVKPAPGRPTRREEMGVEGFRPMQDHAMRVTARYGDAAMWAALDMTVCSSMRTGRLYERLLASARAAQARDLAAMKDPAIAALFPGGPDEVRAMWATTLASYHSIASQSYDAAIMTARYVDAPSVDPVDGKDCRAEAVALKAALDGSGSGP